jgi:hypothetical protein
MSEDIFYPEGIPPTPVKEEQAYLGGTPTPGAESSMMRVTKLAPPKYITFNGQTKTTRAWDKDRGFVPGTISRRLREGWSETDALTTPPVTTNRKPKGEDVFEQLALATIANATSLADRIRANITNQNHAIDQLMKDGDLKSVYTILEKATNAVSKITSMLEIRPVQQERAFIDIDVNVAQPPTIEQQTVTLIDERAIVDIEPRRIGG